MNLTTISRIDNFLQNKNCNELIQHFNKNISNTKKYRNTHTLKCVYEPVLNKLNKYFKIFNFKNVDNMEIVLWPKGSFMKPHYDEGDYLSFIVYLNDNYKGGETVINNITMKPKKGSIIIFSNGLYLHNVNTVTDKERYTLIAWYK
jgi:hypothetical protein|tara:strand:- start:54 stop:491 length:438 start_codon:yes stop_codon:yes gene_type:complete